MIHAPWYPRATSSADSVSSLVMTTNLPSHLGLDVAHAAHRHGQDVATQSAAELGQVVGRIHPGIADEETAAKPPGAQIVLDAGHSSHVGDVAGQHPGAYRHAVAGHRERDDHLRLVVAPFLAVAAPTQRGVEAASPFPLLLVRLVDLEIGGRRVVED